MKRTHITVKLANDYSPIQSYVIVVVTVVVTTVRRVECKTYTNTRARIQRTRGGSNIFDKIIFSHDQNQPQSGCIAFEYLGGYFVRVGFLQS